MNEGINMGEQLKEKEEEKTREQQFAETLWDNLGFLCRKNNVSDSQLEEKLGFSDGYLHAVQKKGKNSIPNVFVLKKIADYFAMPLDAIAEENFQPLGYREDIRRRVLLKLEMETQFNKLVWSMTKKYYIQEMLEYNYEMGSYNSSGHSEFNNHDYPMVQRQTQKAAIATKLPSYSSMRKDGQRETVLEERDVGRPKYHSFVDNKEYDFHDAIADDKEYADNWYNIEVGNCRFMAVRFFDFSEDPVKDVIEIYMQTKDCLFPIGSSTGFDKENARITKALYDTIEKHSKDEHDLSKDFKDAIVQFLTF